ncbi:hypothetical protein KEM52_005847 [Ascosphaera acerosa]|nr:hypothetical protein KEM52_005847 [Ascosphaera acerosa]
MTSVDDTVLFDSDTEADIFYVTRGRQKSADRGLQQPSSASTRSKTRPRIKYHVRSGSSDSTLRRAPVTMHSMTSSSSESLSTSGSSHGSSGRSAGVSATDAHEDDLAMFDDHDLPMLDPKRFTPTLHASLVSEILALRRELEGRDSTIQTLETSLEEARDANDGLTQSLADLNREHRKLKRQVSLIQGGNFSAVEELAQERDELALAAQDLRDRLEQAHQRLRSQEADHTSSSKQWEQEQQRWQQERSELMTKFQITENRLMTVMNEMLAQQQQHALTPSRPASSSSTVRTAHTPEPSSRSSSPDVPCGGQSRQSTGRVSPDSCDDDRTVRFSVDSVCVAPGGLNLADELQLDGDESVLGSTSRPSSRTFAPLNDSDVGIDFARSLSAMSKRSSIRWSSIRSSAASPATMSRLQTIDGVLEVDDTSVVEDTLCQDVAVQADLCLPGQPAEQHDGHARARQLNYRDSSTQCTPDAPRVPSVVGYSTEAGTPSSRYVDVATQYDANISAALPQTRYAEASLASTDTVEPLAGEQLNSDVELSGSDAQDLLPSSTLADAVEPAAKLTSAISNISTSCQTTIELLEGLVRYCADHGLTPAPVLDGPGSTTESVAVQTEDYVSVAAGQHDRSVGDIKTFEVPYISIHPPDSLPPSPTFSAVLPPNTRNAFCQVDRSAFSSSCSRSTQTEEIRIDRRKFRSPQRLLLPSPLPYHSNDEQIPCPPPKSPRRRLFQLIRRGDALVPTAVGDPPNAVESPHAAAAPVALRTTRDRSATDSVLLAKTAEAAPTSPLQAHVAHHLDKLDEAENEDDEVLSRSSFISMLPGTLQREPSQRNGHGSDRAKAPPEAHAAVAATQPDSQLPYPVPTRSSSRRRSRPSSRSADAFEEPLLDSADEMPAWAVPVRGDVTRPSSSSQSQGDGTKTPITRAQLREPIKRVRAQANPKPAKTPGTSVRTVTPAAGRSPTPPSLSDLCAPSSPLAPLSPPSVRRDRADSHLRPLDPSRPASNRQRASVVDSIAQTMVGEWMWKYVRRRKSFSRSESRSRDAMGAGAAGSGSSGGVGEDAGGGGSRHKRWVWLAPYERAVMWSSKQPTSGSALLGKRGRKLTVQSVLDVKDENPLPRGASQENHFNRSIVILTSERALKFTAMNLERHRTWLAALSFLSHPAVGMNDLAAIPPVPPSEFSGAPTPTLRRSRIRDSVRVAKGKRRFGKLSDGRLAALSGKVVSEAEGDDGGLRGGGGGGGIVNDAGFLTAVEDHDDVADPPSVPRFGRHAFRRGGTGARLPGMETLRSFSSSHNLAAAAAASPASHSRTHLHSPSTGGGGDGLFAFSASASAHASADDSAAASPVVPSSRAASRAASPFESLASTVAAATSIGVEFGATGGGSGGSAGGSSSSYGGTSATRTLTHEDRQFFDAVRHGTVRMEAFVQKRPSTSDDWTHGHGSASRRAEMAVWTTRTDFPFSDGEE